MACLRSRLYMTFPNRKSLDTLNPSQFVCLVSIFSTRSISLPFIQLIGEALYTYTALHEYMFPFALTCDTALHNVPKCEKIS